MTCYYFLYKRIGKRQTWNLWAIVEAEDIEKAAEEGQRTYFIGDFKYEFVCTVESSITL